MCHDPLLSVFLVFICFLIVSEFFKFSSMPFRFFLTSPFPGVFYCGNLSLISSFFCVRLLTLLPNLDMTECVKADDAASSF